VNKNLSLIATLVPLVIVAIGLVGWVLSLRSDVTATVQQLDAVIAEVEDVRSRLNELEKGLAIADDQMRTINSEHEIIGELFEELGETLPAGERRTYGGYN
jgi:predicted nuclease with TOPRIM domain|tara:strand:+ start:210 stop:512 length:303 start_codon:yes stop_codon:yes gene_type:complete